MVNVELINLVTTNLVQKKSELEYRLRVETHSDNGSLETTLNVLKDYTSTINEINLWETLLNDIQNPQKETEGVDNN